MELDRNSAPPPPPRKKVPVLLIAVIVLIALAVVIPTMRTIWRKGQEQTNPAATSQP